MKRIIGITAAITLALSAFTVNAHENHPELYTGWNLITGTNETPEEFHNEHPNCTVIWEWDNGWQGWFADHSNNEIEYLSSANGYWIYCH